MTTYSTETLRRKRQTYHVFGFGFFLFGSSVPVERGQTLCGSQKTTSWDKTYNFLFLRSHQAPFISPLHLFFGFLLIFNQRCSTFNTYNT